MMGVFVQVNTTSRARRGAPVGYVIEENGCWTWVGNRIWNGYGQWNRNGKTILAHRALYETERGPVPMGLQLDHLCRNRDCVNLDHLEPVTARINTHRGNAPAGKECQENALPPGARTRRRQPSTQRRRKGLPRVRQGQFEAAMESPSRERPLRRKGNRPARLSGNECREGPL